MTIGPEPMMQIDSMSVRLGSSKLLDPDRDDRSAVVRPRARLGMELRRARTQLRVVQAFDGAVVERGVRDAVALARRDRESVVLRGDEHAARLVVDDGMVRAAMAERELERLVSGRECEQLV